MEVEERKLRNFERLVISDAKKKRDEVLNQLQVEKDKKLSDIKSELTEKYERKLSREIDRINKDKNQHIADKLSANKKELLSKRESLISGIFDRVIEKLADYMKTDDYRENLKKQIEENIKDLSDSFVIVINENDIAAQNLGYKFEFTTENLYGGCRIIDKINMVQIDLTNKTKLEKERDAFLEKYNLKI